MAIKVSKRAEADLGKLGSVGVTLSHVDGATTFQFGFAEVKLDDVRKFIANSNEVLAAIGEATL
jgi:hypothetical protein